MSLCFEFERIQSTWTIQCIVMSRLTNQFDPMSGVCTKVFLKKLVLLEMLPHSLQLFWSKLSYLSDTSSDTEIKDSSHKNFIKLFQMCDAGIQKQVLHITSVQFPLHDCHRVGIFIWEFIELHKGIRSRDLIVCCPGNGHRHLHGPEMRNCSAMWSEPPPWSCKLLEALSHRN